MAKGPITKTTAFTDAAIRSFAPSRKGVREISEAASSLRLLVWPSGKKSFAMRFRRPDGKAAKLTLGTFLPGKEIAGTPVVGQLLSLAAARELLAIVQRQRKLGIDVVNENRAKRERERDASRDRLQNTFTATLHEFFVEYRTKKRLRPRRWREDAALLGLYWPPGADPASIKPTVKKASLSDVWASKPIAEIDGHDVHTVVGDARKRGGDGRARKLHAALSVLFTWLAQQRRVSGNPAHGVFRPGPPPPRERVLSNSEIAAFWIACEHIGQPFGPLFRILLLTGCRLQEVAGMRRSELSDDGTSWTIPGSRTKNGRTHVIPLPPLARSIIADMPVILNSDYIFSTTGKSPVSGFSKAKKLLDAEMTKLAGPLPPWRLHDLRRTTATGLASLGVQLPVVERLLNHVSGSFGGVAGVYQRHEFSTEKRDALERWAVHLQGLSAPQANVGGM